mmetsp:Transcript_60985/g.68242  ORF Transcript_60985/g.68242 Transcript_60985/m.68242 type:complete len:100 (-) Transcript_60985:33-332(-)
MLMSSDHFTCTITYKIFDLMEMGMMKYHKVARKKNLVNLFMEERKKRYKDFDENPPIPELWRPRYRNIWFIITSGIASRNGTLWLLNFCWSDAIHFSVS